MSSTRYSRDRMLRMTGDEQRILARLVMDEIEDLSHAPAAVGDPEAGRQRLRDLRSLLERLSV